MTERKDSRTSNNTPDLDLTPAEQAALRDLRVFEAYVEARRLARSLRGAR
jgi:hypothetical protein